MRPLAGSQATLGGRPSAISSLGARSSVLNPGGRASGSMGLSISNLAAFPDPLGNHAGSQRQSLGTLGLGSGVATPGGAAGALGAGAAGPGASAAGGAVKGSLAALVDSFAEVDWSAAAAGCKQGAAAAASGPEAAAAAAAGAEGDCAGAGGAAHRRPFVPSLRLSFARNKSVAQAAALPSPEPAAVLEAADQAPLQEAEARDTADRQLHRSLSSGTAGHAHISSRRSSGSRPSSQRGHSLSQWLDEPDQAPAAAAVSKAGVASPISPAGPEASFAAGTGSSSQASLQRGLSSSRIDKPGPLMVPAQQLQQLSPRAAAASAATTAVLRRQAAKQAAAASAAAVSTLPCEASEDLGEEQQEEAGPAAAAPPASVLLFQQQLQQALGSVSLPSSQQLAGCSAELLASPGALASPRMPLDVIVEERGTISSMQEAAGGVADAHMQPAFDETEPGFSAGTGCLPLSKDAYLQLLKLQQAEGLKAESSEVEEVLAQQRAEHLQEQRRRAARVRSRQPSGTSTLSAAAGAAAAWPAAEGSAAGADAAQVPPGDVGACDTREAGGRAWRGASGREPPPYRSAHTGSRAVPATTWPLSTEEHSALRAEQQRQQGVAAAERVQQARAAELQSQEEARQHVVDAHKATREQARHDALVRGLLLCPAGLLCNSCGIVVSAG